MLTIWGRINSHNVKKVVWAAIEMGIAHRRIDIGGAFGFTPEYLALNPNRLIPTVNDVTSADEVALGRMVVVAARLAEQEGVAVDGYRLIVNCNAHGGQEVFHLHMHLLGGRRLGAMLRRE